MLDLMETRFTLAISPNHSRKNLIPNKRICIALLYFFFANLGEAQENNSREGTVESVKNGGSTVYKKQEFDLSTYEALGYRIAEIFSIDPDLSTEEFEALARGLNRKWGDSGPPADYDSKSRQSELAGLMTAHQKRSESKLSTIRAAKDQKNRSEGDTFLAQLDEASTTLKTASGLYYTIIQQGSGKTPNPTNEVRFHLRGSRLNGETYINTYESNQPSTAPIQRLIPGLQEGLKLLSEGGKATLFVPPNLAYRDKGNGPIEPGETLTLEVELVEVIDTAPSGPPESIKRQMRAQANQVLDGMRKKKAEEKDGQ